jgi:hypothetical protein
MFYDFFLNYEPSEENKQCYEKFKEWIKNQLLDY